MSRHIFLLSLAVVAVASACRPTTHTTTPADLGAPVFAIDLDAVVDEPGPIEVESVVAADWAVPRSGLINLDSPKAKAAGLVDGDEPIQIYFHALRHPTRGLYLVDTGVERALRDDPDHAALSGFIARQAGIAKLRVRTDTRSWIAAHGGRVDGVFLTHLHIDHTSGMPDVPSDTPVYVGPREARETAFLNFFLQRTTDAELEGKGVLREWRFAPDARGAFEGVADIFGDRSLFALHVPGHTVGSTAFLARTPSGPVLLTGDASHTAWGWQNGVEPGSFSADRPRSAESLARLKAFVAKHPRIDVRLGHQRNP